MWRVGAAVAIAFGLHVASTAVHAEIPGAAASATQRALANYVNDCAQRTIDCSTPTPTVTSTATGTPSVPATPDPTPTSTLEPTLVPTDVPCWLTDPDVGDPDSAYIVFDETTGEPVPCPTETVVVEDPTDEPTPTLALTSTVAPILAPAPAAFPQRPSDPTIQPQDTYTPYPTYTPLATYTVAATMTATLGGTAKTTPTATLTPTAAATTTATVVPLGLAAPAPVRTALSATSHWSWGIFLDYLAATIGVMTLLVAFVLRRKVAVWKPRTQKGATDASG